MSAPKTISLKEFAQYSPGLGRPLLAETIKRQIIAEYQQTRFWQIRRRRRLASAYLAIR